MNEGRFWSYFQNEGTAGNGHASRVWKEEKARLSVFFRTGFCFNDKNCSFALLSFLIFGHAILKS